MKKQKTLEEIELANKRKKVKYTYAESISILLKDKLVEIHVGDNYELIKFSDTELNFPCIYIGKVVGALDDCLILNGYKIDKKSKTKSFGNYLYINGFSIKCISEVDDNGAIKDAWISYNLKLNEYTLVNEDE